jgi:acetolactate synthase-1/2/3 large subunit
MSPRRSTGIRAALQYNGPVLTRIVTDYGNRPIRWLEAARARYTKELTTQQKTRFAARLGSRALELHPRND